MVVSERRPVYALSTRNLSMRIVNIKQILTVADQSVDLLGTILPQNTSGQPDCVTSVNHIIDEDCHLSLDITDKQLHFLNNV